MEDELDEFGTLESNHRKEKKELQAKIQGLKKAAKNDKTKKKELAIEITRLETDLEAKHKYEIKTYLAAHGDNSTQDNSPTDQDANADVTQHKISKAQKRRDKKSQQERERDEQIKLQEKENVNGPRNIEMQTIADKLKDKQLKIFAIASDGDCLYKAVSHQLITKKHTKMSVPELRSKVSHYIRENKDDFFPFMSNPETCNMLTDAEFEEYCDKIRDTKVWGGQLELRALSNILTSPITVIQAAGLDAIEQGTEFEGPPLLITYHRHMFSLGEHYNSTTGDIEGEDGNIVYLV